MSTVVPRILTELSEVHGAQLMRALTARHLLQTELMLSVADSSISGISMTVSIWWVLCTAMVVVTMKLMLVTLFVTAKTIG